MKKAKEELEKAKFSKTFNVEINGKKVNPENMLTPLDDLEDSNDPNSSENNQNSDSPKKMKLGNLGNPILNPITVPMNEGTFDRDIKKIDQGFTNQSSIEDAINVEEIDVDEDGNPIDHAKDMPELEQTVQDENDKEDELQTFVDNIQPVTDKQNASNALNDSNLNPSDKLDDDLDHIIDQDLDDKQIPNNDDIPQNLENVTVSPNGSMFKDPLETPEDLSEMQNRMFKPSNRLREEDQDFPHRNDDSEGNSNALDNNITNTTNSFEDPLDMKSDSNSENQDEDFNTKRDNFYANELVNDVEKNLDNELPMKKFRFGNKDWETKQVYTDDVKDEGILGAGINKYPEMSDAMKNKLDKEIRENGGYPEDKTNQGAFNGNVIPGQQKMAYMPFHVEDGDLQYSPLNHIRFVV